MKKFSACLPILFLVLCPLLYGQPSQFPYMQSFEEGFALGPDTEFLPAWFGNEVQQTSRIYQNNVAAQAGSFALAAQATGSFTPLIELELNTLSLVGAEVSFWMASAANGSGTRPAIVSISFSADGGQSYTTELEVTSLPNANSSFKQYTFGLPLAVLQQASARIRWRVQRGEGSGTVALMLMDEIAVYQAEAPPPPATTNFRDVVINEIFADPNPKGDLIPLPQVLPTDSRAEWIELYNPSTSEIYLTNWQLNGKAIPDFILQPNAYALLLPEDFAPAYQQYGQIVPMPNWNSLSNSGEKLLLQSANGAVVDSLTYALDWYQSSSKSNGGWSVEQVRASSGCSSANNWKASEASIGATPGQVNSVYNPDPDLRAPELIEAVWLSANQIRLRFSEVVSPITSVGQFGLGPPLPLLSLQNYGNTLIITSQARPSSGPEYTIMFTVADCNGNTTTGSSLILNPRSASAGELVLNELMYDPGPNGAEWVELYNTTADYLNIAGWYLALRDNGNTATVKLSEGLLLIAPGGFLVITSDTEALVGQFPATAPEHVLNLPRLFSFKNDGDTLALLNLAGDVVDRLGFTDNLHHPLIRDSQGVSLERINPLIMDEYSNWTSASTQNNTGLLKGLGTPGKANSQWQLTTSTTNILQVEPTVIHPLPDGVNDVALITYNVAEPNLSGEIIVLDAQGRKVITLLKNSLLGMQGQLQWAGTDAQGNAVSSGYYIVSLQTIDGKGRKSLYRKTIVVGH